MDPLIHRQFISSVKLSSTTLQPHRSADNVTLYQSSVAITPRWVFSSWRKSCNLNAIAFHRISQWKTTIFTNFSILFPAYPPWCTLTSLQIIPSAPLTRKRLPWSWWHSVSRASKRPERYDVWGRFKEKETIDFPIKYGVFQGFPVKFFPLNQSIENWVPLFFYELSRFITRITGVYGDSNSSWIGNKAASI